MNKSCDTAKQQHFGRGQNPNTVANRFVKGDPRINRKGRPQSFDQLRELAKSIAKEKITLPNGQKIDRIEAILRIWCGSKDLAQQIAFVQYAYGKVPDKLEGVQFPHQTLILHYDHERKELNGRS